MDLKFDIFTSSSYQTFITGRPYTEIKSHPECCRTSTASQILQPLGHELSSRGSLPPKPRIFSEHTASPCLYHPEQAVKGAVIPGGSTCSLQPRHHPGTPPPHQWHRATATLSGYRELCFRVLKRILCIVTSVT